MLPIVKGRARLFVFLLSFIAAGIVALRVHKHREPAYNGKALSEWLDRTRSDIDATQRVCALQQIGTNALPLLLEWIQCEPSPLEFKFYGWLSYLHINPINGKFSRREEALEGFAALGEGAKPAIPSLALLIDSTNILTQIWAVQALGAIGKDALPILVDVVTNSMAHTNCDRLAAAVAFSNLKTNSFVAKSFMLAHIRDPDAQVASSAIFVLGTLGAIQETMALPPDSTADIVPALCANLDTTNTYILVHTIRALAHFRSNGEQAVTVLKQQLTSTNSAIRSAAATALEQLEPKDIDAR